LLAASAGRIVNLRGGPHRKSCQDVDYLDKGQEVDVKIKITPPF
jgi:hypothetical protein